MKDKMNRWKDKYVLIPLVGLWLLLLGMHMAIYTALDGGIQCQDVVLVYGIVALVLLVLVWLPGRWTLAGVGGGLAGIGIYLWRTWDRIGAEIQILAYHVNLRNMAYVNRTLLPQSWCKKGTLDHNTMILLLCIIFGWYIAFLVFRFHSKFYGFIPVVLIYCCGLLLGKAPGQFATLLLALGMGMSMMWLSEQQSGSYVFQSRHKWEKGERGKRYLLALFILAVCVTGAWYLAAQIADKAFQNVAQMQKRQHDIEITLQQKSEETGQYLRSLLGVDGGGRLSNTSPRYQDKKVMEVTLDRKPEQSVYLRGFVGDIYHGGKWSASHEIAHDKNVTMTRKWGQDHWSGTYNDSEYTRIIGEAQDISIRYTKFGRRSKYLYLPYSEDNAVNLVSTEERKCCLGDEDDYLELYEKLVKEWTEWDYIDFEMDDSSIQMLQEILWDNAEYSTDLDPVPYNQDYAEYFLFISQKGYCEHFATAGTLLLRYLGFCARYATGYRIAPERFEENEDGSYTAEVLDSDAHAWSEILKSNRHWLPQEMTPDSDDTSAYQESGGSEKPDAFQGTAAGIPDHPDAAVTAAPQDADSEIPQVQETAVPTASQTAQQDTASVSGTGGSQQGDDTKSGEGTRNSRGWLGKLPLKFWISLGIGGLLALGLCVTIIYRYRRKQKRMRRMTQMRTGNPKYYVGMRLGIMLDRMRKSGLAVHDGMAEQQWMTVMVDALGEEVSPQDTGELLDLARKAAYSQEMILPEEVQWLDRYCEKIEFLVKNKKK